MKKTGEAYTAAREQITRKPRTKTQTASSSPPVLTARPAPDPKEYGALAGMSDAAIKEKTGCAWDKWVKSLDHYGAEPMSHRDVAALVHEKYKIDGWWAQSVTVGYERIKGLRTRGQRRDGMYETSKSRTFDVPVGTLFDAWVAASIRRRWLNEAGVNVRTATSPKSMRLGWTDGTSLQSGSRLRARRRVQCPWRTRSCLTARQRTVSSNTGRNGWTRWVRYWPNGSEA